MSEPDDIVSGFGEIPDPLGDPERKHTVGEQRAPALPSAPNRAEVLRRRGLAALLSLGWVGGHLAIYGIRSDLAELPLPYLVAEIVAPLVLSALSLLIAMSSGKFGLGVSVGTVIALAVVGPISFWMLALGAPEPRPVEPDKNFWINAALCLDLTLAWAAVPLLMAGMSLRRAFAAGSRARSALVGAACGLFSGGIMNLHCSSVDGEHMVLGHGVPVLVAASVGAALLSRWARA